MDLCHPKGRNYVSKHWIIFCLQEFTIGIQATENYGEVHSLTLSLLWGDNYCIFIMDVVIGGSCRVLLPSLVHVCFLRFSLLERSFLHVFLLYSICQRYFFMGTYHGLVGRTHPYIFYASLYSCIYFPLPKLHLKRSFN